MLRKCPKCFKRTLQGANSKKLSRLLKSESFNSQTSGYIESNTSLRIILGVHPLASIGPLGVQQMVKSLIAKNDTQICSKCGYWIKL